MAALALHKKPTTDNTDNTDQEKQSHHGGAETLRKSMKAKPLKHRGTEVGDRRNTDEPYKFLVL
jgi:hypothetical protein